MPISSPVRTFQERAPGYSSDAPLCSSSTVTGYYLILFMEEMVWWGNIFSLDWLEYHVHVVRRRSGFLYCSPPVNDQDNRQPSNPWIRISSRCRTRWARGVQNLFKLFYPFQERDHRGAVLSFARAMGEFVPP